MKKSAQVSLIIANIYLDISKKYFESVLPEVSADTKQFINRLINRINANQIDTLARIGNDESRQMFIDEIRRADTLLYNHIILQLLAMTAEQKLMAEKCIDGIVKGELIEFV